MSLALPARYLRYVRDCAGWGTPATSWEEFKAYWDLFGRPGELSNVPVGTSAPILVQGGHQPGKAAFGGHYQQTSGHRL